MNTTGSHFDGLNISIDGSGVVIAEYPVHAKISGPLLNDELERLNQLDAWPICYLLKFRGISFLDREITGFISEAYPPGRFKAVALVFDSEYGFYTHGKILLDTFLKLDGLDFPVRKFEDHATAMSWLREHL